MSTMTDPDRRALLDRAEKLLVELRYREQAALFHAAAASLEAAIKKAERGEAEELDNWLRQNHVKLGHPASLVQQSAPPLEIDHVMRYTSHNSVSTTSMDSDSAKADEPKENSLPVVSKNPWEKMETAAALRLRTQSVQQSTASKDIRSKVSVATNIITSDQAIAKGVSEAIREDLARSPKNSPLVVRESKPIKLIPELQNAKVTRRKPFYASVDIWGSLAAHIGLVLVLGTIVLTQVKHAERVAIVSAAYESDIALTETPFESESESLDVTESSSFAESPILSEIPNISIQSVDISIDNRSLVGNQTEPSLAEQMKKAISSMTQGSSLQASFFGLKATGNVFVYLVDASPSMRKDGAFDAARDEMIRSLTSMNTNQRFYIIFFGKQVDRMSFSGETPEASPVAATPENIQKAIEWLNRATVQKDGWPPNEALKAAIELNPDAVFLLFDGNTRVDVAKFLGQVNRVEDIISGGEPKVSIHVVHFFDEDYAAPMQRVARENRGTYRFVPRPQRERLKR